MGKRRRARELALKVLYRIDLTGESWDEVKGRLEEYDRVDGVRDFGSLLVEAVLDHRDELDGILTETAENWRIDRMALLDRNVLRLALAEYLVIGETPRAVVIDEAVEIAGTFSTEGSGAFVNGILDRIFRNRNAGELGGSPAAEEGPAGR
ncbi:MAG: transcription antitermination factor NusB [Candidatus Eisenbacteria bacterium]